MNFLKNHPFAVEAFFDSSVVLTFALPKEQLQSRIPEPLQLDTFQGKWAFLAVAMVQTRALRPKGFPRFMGNDFFLIGYRIFVRYTNAKGKNLRGLYILKSETDKRKMTFWGNVFTHYNYRTTDVRQTMEGALRCIESRGSGLKIAIDQSPGEVALPEHSPFADWKEAARFAGPLPFTFMCNPAEKTVLIIEGVRQNWRPQPLRLHHYELDFLRQTQLEHAVLANAFEIRNVPYYWKKGKMETWT